MCTAFVLLALTIAGCGPQFQNEDEERAYLNNQMNPSIEQFRRRGELNEKYKEVDHERAMRGAEDGMNHVIGNLCSNTSEEKKAVEAYLKSSTEQARAARESGTAPR